MRGIALSLAFAALLPAGGASAAERAVLYETDLAGTAAYRFPLPLPAGFRLSGGVALNGNQITINTLANGTSTVTINRVTWSEGGSVAVNRVGFKDMAPYGGLGYSRNFGSGFKLSADAGAMFGATPLMPHAEIPGISDELALRNEYLESRNRAIAVEPVGEVTLSFRF